MTISLQSYNCHTRTAVLNVSSPPDHIAIYAWDDSGGGADPEQPPPSDCKVIAGASGTVTISNVPHENGATQIMVCVWGINLHVAHTEDCSSSSSGSSSDGDPQIAQHSVLP